MSEGDKRESIAEAAGRQVASILAAAEEKAAAIEREARAEAERILADARAEASRRVEAAQEGVDELLGRLRERIGGETEPAIVPEPSVPQPEVDPTPVIVPEPTPERTPEPTPDPVPEPVPDPTPEPAPAPAPEPAPLPQPDSPPQSPAATNGDAAAAKLVAMKMALDGADREEIAAKLASSYGLDESDPLLDEVLARVSK